MKTREIYFIVLCFTYPSNVAKAGTRLCVRSMGDREVGDWEITKANLI